MSDACKNFATVLDVLEEHNVIVTDVDHEQHDWNGDSEFDLTVVVPTFSKSDLREEREGGCDVDPADLADDVGSDVQ